MYEQTKSVTETILILGYPGFQGLYKWIKDYKQDPKEKKTFRGINPLNHLRHPSVELKLEVFNSCMDLGEDVKLVSDEIRYSRDRI